MSSDEQKIDIWLDCDPGIDDTFAMILSAYSPKINLLGISTVSGNSNVEYMTKNTLKILNLIGYISNESLVKNFDKDELNLNDYSKFGLSIPVIQGSSYPFLGKPVSADHIHGEYGITGDFPSVPQHAIDFVAKISSEKIHFTTQIYNYLKSLGKKITILAIGPLTNIGLLLFNHPDVKNYIEKLVFMGGSLGLGNITPCAEFNIYSDPIAASIVIHSDLNIHMVPLEATNNAQVTQEIISNLRKSHSTRFMNVATHLLEFLLKTSEQFYKNKECPLIDAVAAFYLIRPDLFKTRLIRVDVDTGSRNYSYGQTTCDLYEVTDRDKNVQVCYSLDHKGADVFWSHMIDALLKANDVSKNIH